MIRDGVVFTSASSLFFRLSFRTNIQEFRSRCCLRAERCVFGRSRGKHQLSGPLCAPALYAPLQGPELGAGRVKVGHLPAQPYKQFAGGEIGFRHQPAFHEWPALRERFSTNAW
jgi:hypothetical protein